MSFKVDIPSKFSEPARGEFFSGSIINQSITGATATNPVVITSNGLLKDLADSNLSKDIPVILGSNKDELSLWLGVHRYFVKVIYPFTRLIPIPRIKILDPDLYTSWVKIRSDAWKYRGVDEPLIALEKAGYSELFAYRFDWDDQRRSFYANTPKLLGASHGVEIAFLTGDFQYGPVTKYVYPNNDARYQMQETMMQAWSTFAQNGKPIIFCGDFNV